MNNWDKKILCEVADVKLSNVDKTTNPNEKTIRLCNYTDVYKNSYIDSKKAKSFMVASCSERELENFKLRKGQVAITKDSETRDDIGVSTYISEDFDDVVLGYHTSLITPDERILDGRFLYFWLNTGFAKRYFENNAGGSGQRCTLPLEIIQSFPLYLPDLKTQQKIASVLFSLDFKIELNNYINEELESIANTLYNYWFVQFDFPDKEGKPYKTSGGEMEWNEDLKKDIPKGWKVQQIKEVASIKAGGDKPKIFSNESNEHCHIPIYSNGIINEGLYGYTDKALIHRQSITISARGTIGYCILRNRPFVPIIRLIVITPNKINSAKYFHEHFCSLQYGKSGSVQQQLTIPDISSWKMIIPEDIILEKYNNLTASYVIRIDNLKEENKELIKLRDFLLPLLMNGQVKVK